MVLPLLLYRIYSIYRPGRLFNFGPMKVCAYSRWALTRGWALIISPTFSASEDTFSEQGIKVYFASTRQNKV